MRVKRFSVIIAICVSACSGGSNDNGPGCGSNASCAPPELSPAESITGLWDRGGELHSEREELYTYIGEDGQFLVYDYTQDSVDARQNCYSLVSGRIWRYLESSRYQIEFSSEKPDPIGFSENAVTIYLQGNNLYVRWESGVEESWLPLQGIAQQDLTLCEQEASLAID